MLFGSDFFKIFRLVVGILRLFSEIFGNGKDAEALDMALNGDKKPVKKQ